MNRFLIVCPLVFLAGFVDSIAGGGGLISFPAYMFAGVPVHVTMGTSKLSAFPGAITAAARFAKGGYIRWRFALLCAAAAFGGSIIGAGIALQVDERVIQSLMLVVLPVLAFYVLRDKGGSEEREKKELPAGQMYAAGMAASFLIGMYDGFYGPGTGTFLILVFSNVVRLGLKEAAGAAKVVNLCADIGALGTFFAGGKVDYRLGIAAALFCIVGSYIGAGLVVKNGHRIVRPVVIVVLLLLFVKIGLERV
ncbi:MAG: TSUP family transporter [Lachnospiraceae bacterium]|nr:TSUP family transporter [Lachnospiraceae bacterium]